MLYREMTGDYCNNHTMLYIQTVNIMHILFILSQRVYTVTIQIKRLHKQ